MLDRNAIEQASFTQYVRWAGMKNLFPLEMLGEVGIKKVPLSSFNSIN